MSVLPEDQVGNLQKQLYFFWLFIFDVVQKVNNLKRTFALRKLFVREVKHLPHLDFKGIEKLDKQKSLWQYGETGLLKVPIKCQSGFNLQLFHNDKRNAVR